MDSLFAILAMAPPPGGDPSKAPSPLMMPMMLVFMIALMYVMVIRPQRRKEKERQALVNAVKTGDRVLFGGGIIGIVANVKDKTVVVKVADKTKVEILRGAVQQVLNKDDLPGDLEVEAPQASIK